MNRLSILGTRGIPAAHGGFETFAEFLALYLVKQGWVVTVYCQEDGRESVWQDEWKGVRLIHIPVKQQGAIGTIVFDWKSTFHASNQEGLILTLGYNTAVFALLYRIKGKLNIFNMDGLEWQRKKWSLLERSWLYLNERIGCLIGNHLIADHPEIKQHLLTRVADNKVSMIPYGADKIIDADVKELQKYNIMPHQYCLVIARPEPENSILEIVRAFSAQNRGHALVILGKYVPEDNEYHRQVMEAASDEVLFPGAVYDSDTVKSLRYYCKLYIHGHTVGGTNPSLVEALGSGSAILAHDNKFNRWVTGNGAMYFASENDCSRQFDVLLADEEKLNQIREFSVNLHQKKFTWEIVLKSYEQLLTKWL